MQQPLYSVLFLAVFSAALALLCPQTASVASATEQTVRNEFGPSGGGKPNLCRGACGGGCPKSCDITTSYECTGESRFRRVVSYDCGTHEGCRAHDYCLDRCLKGSGDVGACSKQCDGMVVHQYGIDKAGSWLTGGGPYDGRKQFEYTRDADNAPEPIFRCPEGASEQCSGRVGCMAGGSWMEPAFDGYSESAGGTLQVSAFRAGPACGDSVCRQSAAIEISGDDSCPGGQCTRFGMEFDYRNADPAVPLECRTSTSSEGDFIGDLLKQGADAMESRGTMPDPESENGMEALVGLFGKVLASADSAEDVNISMTPLDENGNPIESQRVGSQPADGPPPIPSRVELPAASGHLFVPMYQLADAMQPGESKERRVICKYKGNPALETTFRLVRK